jgi:hypothetical protein
VRLWSGFIWLGIETHLNMILNLGVAWLLICVPQGSEVDGQ